MSTTTVLDQYTPRPGPQTGQGRTHIQHAVELIAAAQGLLDIANNELQQVGFEDMTLQRLTVCGGYINGDPSKMSKGGRLKKFKFMRVESVLQRLKRAAGWTVVKHEGGYEADDEKEA